MTILSFHKGSARLEKATKFGWWSIQSEQISVQGRRSVKTLTLLEKESTHCQQYVNSTAYTCGAPWVAVASLVQGVCFFCIECGDIMMPDCDPLDQSLIDPVVNSHQEKLVLQCAHKILALNENWYGYMHPFACTHPVPNEVTWLMYTCDETAYAEA